MKNIKTFFQTMKKSGIRYRGFMVIYIILAILANSAIIAVSYVRGEIGEATLLGDVGVLIWLLIILTGMMVVRAISAALIALIRGRFSAKAGYSLRESFINYFLRVPLSKFEKVGSGESLSIFANDVPQAALLISQDGMQMIEEFIYFIAALVFMFIINPLLTLVLLVIIPLIALLQILCSVPIQKRAVTMSEETARFNAVVNDSLQNVSTIAAYNLEEVLEERYLSVYDDFIIAVKGYIKAMLPLVSVGFIAASIPIGVINIVAAFRVLNNNMTIAEFIAFTSIAIITVEWLGMLSQRLNAFQTAAAGAKRLNDNTAEALEDMDSGERLDMASPVSISFKDVSFSYSEDAQLALDGVSFEIKPGARVAFVGGSGSGKSTVLKLLLGLYEPDSGEISFGGTGAEKLAKGSIRDGLAYVPQDCYLFPESIGGNIMLESQESLESLESLEPLESLKSLEPYESSGTQAARLEKACEDAGVLEFIKTLHDGFDSVLTESAENISGGQRQRIAMARAFYKNSPVILFDEATSALDPVTEASIFDSFDAATEGKTVIMVAHRTRAISACDTIVVMDSGKVSGIGSHDELLEANDVYRSLYETQCMVEQQEAA